MTTDIIINSGIQFISILVNLTDEVVNKVKLRFSEEIVEQKDEGDVYRLKEVYYWDDEEMFIDKNSINQEAYSKYGVLEPKDINREYIIEIEEDETYSVSGKEALEICEGHWIPVPYFRIRQSVDRPFHHGPEDWCRMNLQPQINDELGTTHVLVLAFDTSSEKEEGNT